eukprot:2899820-Rhodomonas_salina.1
MQHSEFSTDGAVWYNLLPEIKCTADRCAEYTPYKWLQFGYQGRIDMTYAAYRYGCRPACTAYTGAGRGRRASRVRRIRIVISGLTREAGEHHVCGVYERRGAEQTCGVAASP